MVDSVNNSPGGILPRVQSATLTALNNSQRTDQKIIDNKANGAPPTTVQQNQKLAGTSNEPLPRGSLVDFFA